MSRRVDLWIFLEAMTIFELQDELQALQDIESYRIESDHDFSSEDPEPLLEGVVQSIVQNLKPLAKFITPS